MWWPANKNKQPFATTKSMCAPISVARRIFILIALLLVACLFNGCAGYQLAADMPSVIGTGDKTIKFKDVEYPTLQPWLPYLIRSTLRNEIHARHMAKWVDHGQADYEIRIDVNHYTTNEWMTDQIDRGLLYDTTLSITAIIFESSTNKEIWNSGPMSYADRFEAPNERLVADDLVTQLMRRLVDKMRNTF